MIEFFISVLIKYSQSEFYNNGKKKYTEKVCKKH